MNDYIGHPSQLSGVEEVILAHGKGKGMTLLQIRNGKGLEMTLSPDRCMDIARLSLKGDNIGYFAPCGYVAPAFYESDGSGFLKSFTAGFLTTCGLGAVGSPCTDNGERLPLHGTIANTPCEQFRYYETDDAICVIGSIRDATLFGTSYLLTRTYTVSKTENTFRISDTVRNIGSSVVPCMLLYHINIGYPMLSERSIVSIPHDAITARNQHAEAHIATALCMERPQKDREERCYYYDIKAVNGHAAVGIYNPDIKKGVKIAYQKEVLRFFTEWKMMGIHDYVLGLEPGNCTPDGRDVMRKNGLLLELAPQEEYACGVEIALFEKEEELPC